MTTAPARITPGQAADLAGHLATCHGQVRITADEAADPSFLLALHRIAREQNPEEDGPACAPYTHRQTDEARELYARVTEEAAAEDEAVDWLLAVRKYGLETANRMFPEA
jgi:hypothetical protein